VAERVIVLPGAATGAAPRAKILRAISNE